MKKRGNFADLTSNLLLVGMDGVLTPAHYDEQENLFAQVEGHKRIILMAPSEFSGMYPFPVHHPCDRQSQVDIFNPDLERFPKFAQVSGYDCLVSPGEVLYIPAYWWHHIISLTPTISVNFWYKCGQKDIQPKAANRVLLCDTQRVSLRRNIEKVIGDTVTPQKVKPYFRAVVAGTVEVEFAEAHATVAKLLVMIMPPEEIMGFLVESAEGRYA